MRIKRISIGIILVIIIFVIGYNFGINRTGYFKNMIESSQEHHSPPSVVIEPGSAVETASYVIFHDDETPKNYYAKDGDTGEIEFSGPNFIEDVIDNIIAPNRRIYIKAGTYYAEKSLRVYDVNYLEITCESGCWITTKNSSAVLLYIIGSNWNSFTFNKMSRPGSHTAPFILLEDDLTAGSCSQNTIQIYDLWSTPDPQMAAFHVKSTTSYGVYRNTIMNSYATRVKTGILLENSGSGWINGNNFYNIWLGACKAGVKFKKNGGEISTNTFMDILMQTANDITEIGYMDIAGSRNVFINCKAWDLSGSMRSANITSQAYDTIIIGGIFTNYNFVDNGHGTTIIDQWNTKLSFDYNDFIRYDKSNNRYLFYIGGNIVGYVDNSGFHNLAP